MVVVPERHWAVVERLGRYRRTLTPGRHALVPALESVRALVPMDEQELDLPGTLVITTDNETVYLDTLLRYRIVDPARAMYEVADYRAGLGQLVVHALRVEFADRTADEARSAQRVTAAQAVTAAVLHRRSEAWGIRIIEVTIEPSARSA